MSANVNFMPNGILSSFTTGNTENRAIDVVDFLIENHSDVDIFTIQELYHNKSRQVFTQKT